MSRAPACAPPALRFLLALTLACLVWACSEPTAVTPEVSTDEALEEARAALDEREWDEAIELASLALDAGVDPVAAQKVIDRAKAEQDNLARYEQAKALFEAEQYDKAYAKLASISGNTAYVTRARNLLMRIQQAVALPERIRRTGDALMHRILVGTYKRGSTRDEIDRAMEICESNAGHCQKEWFWRETPREWVTVGSFYIDEKEVTVEQFEACIAAGSCTPPDLRACGVAPDAAAAYQVGQLPQVCVTWEQATSYCRWAGGRLPTESEWERAARGPAQTRYPWGDEWEPGRANWASPGGEDGYDALAPVGRFGPLGYGLFDMAGNAYEWVADRYADKYPEGAQFNPTGPSEGSSRVIRGGAFDRGQEALRAAHRNRMPPDLADKTVGFRCARDPVGLAALPSEPAMEPAREPAIGPAIESE